MSVERILQLAVERLVTIQTDATLADAAKLLCQSQKALLVVCDAAGVMRGVITKTDIVRRVAYSQNDFTTDKAVDIMTRNVTSCKATDSLRDVLTMMKDHGLVHVPIVDEDHRPTGVVNARDALQVLFSELRDEELLLREYVMGIGYR